jgi:cyclopropane fatty-acyl-phospholipid synthase-like methyltransferase
MKENIEYRVETNHPIAEHSHDHINPAGVYDASQNFSFNEAISKIYSNPVVLDLGCAAGTVVESFIVMGWEAIGLEGSTHAYDPIELRPINKVTPTGLQKRVSDHAWHRIPKNLFHCDVTKPFQIYKNSESMRFNIISAWEIFEHIEEEDLIQLFANIDNHLEPGGCIIGSIGDFPDEDRHRIIKGVDWWQEIFKKYGYTIMDNIFFDGPWIRGRGLWKHDRALWEEGFNYIVKK